MRRKIKKIKRIKSYYRKIKGHKHKVHGHNRIVASFAYNKSK